MEWLDIVDEYNRIVGCGLRSFIHREKLRHRTSHLLVFDQEDNLLLQQRSGKKDVFPFCWDTSAAGHLAVGESYLGGALRECEEELGLKLEAIELLGTMPATAQNGWEFTQVFKAYTLQNKINFCEEEICTVRWFNKAILKQMIQKQAFLFTPSFIEIYTHFIS